MRKAILAALSVAAFATFAVAQTKPNFSGTWKLNVSKSDFGVLPGPESRTDIIDHNEPAIKINTSQEGSQGKMAATVNYTTDGKEVTNTIGPREIKSTAAWEGSNLVVNSKLMFNDSEVTIKNVWTLSDDGKTLTENAHLASAMGETDQKFVFEKQEAGAVATAKAAPAAPATAAGNGGKPNFSGTWKMNVAKSDFGPMPAPDSRTDVIEHNDPAMKINVSQKGGQGDVEAVVNYTTDGKEVTNTIAQREQKSTVVWQGSNLVVNSKFTVNDAEITTKSVWTLSEDGKTLTQNIHAESPMGEIDLKWVFDKQAGGAVAAAAKPAPTTGAPVASGPKPNFSGTWKLDVSKSDFGVLPPPNSETDVIEHNDPVLKVITSRDAQEGKQDYTLNLTTDGKESTNDAGGLTLHSILNWEGSNLVENIKLKYQDNDVTVKDVWLLSDDGRTLTHNAHFESPMGEMDQKLVFLKITTP